MEIVTGKLWQLIEKGDNASIFFYLKTQWGWREKERDDGMTPDEFARLAFAAMGAMKETVGAKRD